MKLVYTYIEVQDIQKSLHFYTQLLQMQPSTVIEDRWISFECGNSFALYNSTYDQDLIDSNQYEKHFNEAYINDFKKKAETKKNNIVTLNFSCEHIHDEYKRLKQLEIGTMSELMYVNIAAPYYYFNIIDPDGNTLEICEYTM